MAPAQKARKGRFGAGGTAPVLSVTAFPSSATSGVAATGFAATATDAVDGDLTATLDWASDLDAASVGTGGSPSITLVAVGTHTITVTATAPTGGQTSTFTFEIEVAAP